jgi:hypothetical protein
MKILISPFNMGPIIKGQTLKVTGEFPSGLTFDGIAGVWSKELFAPRPVKCKLFNDGFHEYLIPESIYEKYRSLLAEFDEADQNKCDEFDTAFHTYRIDGSTKIFGYG